MSQPCNENLELFASCLSGLEAPLADELKRLGIKRVRPLGGGVAFFCDVRHALSACLWSRLASRVLVVVGRVNAGDANLLYEGVRRLPWEDVIVEGASMAVQAHGMNDELRNTRFTALKVKDAVATACARCAASDPTWTPPARTRRWTCACARGAPPSPSTCRASRCTTVPTSTPDDAPTRRCRARSRQACWRQPVGAAAAAAARRAWTRRAVTASSWWRRHRPPATRARPDARALGLLRLEPVPARAVERAHRRRRRAVRARARVGDGPGRARRPRVGTARSGVRCASPAPPRRRRPSPGHAPTRSARGCARP